MDIHNRAEKEPNQLIIRGAGSNMKRRGQPFKKGTYS
jgi:hypothetical protein